MLGFVLAFRRGQMSKVLVLGSNSFSGSHFINHCLSQGDEVVGISRSDEINEVFLPYKNHSNYKNFTFYQYNLNHQTQGIVDFIKTFKPDYIVNFIALCMVAESFENPSHWYHANFLSHVELLEHLKDETSIQKYVQISTPEIYGNTEGLVQENTHYQPSTPYAVSKASIDMHLKVLLNTYGFPVVWTRAANVYGACQQLYRIIPKTILYFLTNQNLTLHGGGTSIRSFIHIQDVAQATYLIMKQSKIGSLYHLSTQEQISIKDLVVKIADLLNISFDKYVNFGEERKGKDKAYLLDSSQFTNEFCTDFNTSLEQGLDDCICWVKNNLETLLKQNLNYIHKE